MNWVQEGTVPLAILMGAVELVSVRMCSLLGRVPACSTIPWVTRRIPFRIAKLSRNRPA